MARDIAVSIEVDSPRCGNALFPPADKTVRGRFSFQRVAKHSRDALLRHQEWGEHEFPGQVVAVTEDGKVGLVLEPMHEDQHAVARERLAKRGMKLEPSRQEFPLADDESRRRWLWAMKRLVDSGVAKVVSGSFPRDLQAPPPKPSADPLERLTVAIESLLSRLSPARA